MLRRGTTPKKERPACPGNHVGQPSELKPVDPADWEVPAELRENDEGQVLYRDANCGLLWYQARGTVPGRGYVTRIGRSKGHGFERL